MDDDFDGIGDGLAELLVDVVGETVVGVIADNPDLIPVPVIGFCALSFCHVLGADSHPFVHALQDTTAYYAGAGVAIGAIYLGDKEFSTRNKILSFVVGACACLASFEAPNVFAKILPPSKPKVEHKKAEPTLDKALRPF